MKFIALCIIIHYYAIHYAIIHYFHTFCRVKRAGSRAAEILQNIQVYLGAPREAKAASCQAIRQQPEIGN